MKRMLTGGVLMCSLALIGCGEESDAVDQSVQAYTESSCMLADYDHHDVGGIDPEWSSPTTYDNPNCHKAVVVDMASYSSAYWGSGTASDGHTRVDWNGSIPTTEGACTKMWLGATLYLWSQGNQSYSERIRREAYGRWERSPIIGGEGIFTCLPPSVSFHSTTSPDLIVGRKYRLGITARTENSRAAPTRSVRVGSYKAQSVL